MRRRVLISRPFGLVDGCSCPDLEGYALAYDFLGKMFDPCRTIRRARNSKAIRADLISVLWARGHCWRARREGEAGDEGASRCRELHSRMLLEGAGDAEKPQA